VAPTPAATAVVYTVVAGDSLSLIAGRFGTTWQSLVFWNRDRYPGLNPGLAAYDPNRLTPGWQLVVSRGVVVEYDPALPPAPPPTAAPPSARPTAAPGGTSSTLVSAGSRTSKMVALTFDMGGRTDPALAIMGWLRDHGVPATIFLTGSSVDSSDAARQLAGMVDARPDLFDLGNHSYSHPDLTTMSPAQVVDELRRAEAAIGAYATTPPRPLFRPPYGAWDADVLAGAGTAGYRWTVMWDVDTIDWKPIADGGPTAAQIVDRVLARAQSGSIVLMHLGGYETLSALPAVVDGLRTRGFTLVTLNSLLGQ
jgi:peptidoglycan/xylan/chitin deacetylase (PgdA/CDA1 family)